MLPVSAEPSPTAAPITQGFLFADLRDYTAFVEQRGDRAAVDLLESYRAIVRATVRSFGGAEIKTEGDSFYVVFPSASGAVACALAIQDAAAAASTEDPGRPIRVGIGVHAGETAALDGGFVGLAVNVAARICAQASAGQVLVSDTVRSLTRSSAAFAFVPAGRRRLKGISEPIALYSVAPAGGAPDRSPVRAGSSRTHRWVPLVAIVTVVVIAAGALVGLRSGLIPTGASGSLPTPSGQASPSASSSSPPVVEASDRPLSIGDGLAPHVTAPPGHYRTSHFEPAVAVQLGTGWEAVADDPDLVEIHRQTRSRGNPDGVITFLRPLVVHLGPCPDSPTLALGRTPQDAIAWLRGRADLKVSAPEPVVVGDIPGLQVTMTLPEHDPACPKRKPTDPLGYFLVRTSVAEFLLLAGERVDIAALTVANENVLIVAERQPATAADFDKELGSLLPTIRFP
jgi:class 3 adenylate cyclase